MLGIAIPLAGACVTLYAHATAVRRGSVVLCHGHTDVAAAEIQRELLVSCSILVDSSCIVIVCDRVIQVDSSGVIA